MTISLYSQSSENITLSDAITNCLPVLEGAIGLVYAPQFCQLLTVDSDGNLLNSYDKIVSNNYQNSYIFEARIFNLNYELRWLNEDSGKGKSVLISENNLDNYLSTESNSIEIIKTIDQQYLLWGEKGKTQLNSGWQRVTGARIGSLDIPISTPLSQDKRVYLNFREYLQVMDNFGNVRVGEGRLINLEVK